MGIRQTRWMDNAQDRERMAAWLYAMWNTDMKGHPISEAPRDGTVIIVSVMRIAGVPDTGHYSFHRMVYRSGWHPVDRDNSTYGESTILAWWSDGTPEDQMEQRPRTNFKWQPSNGCGGDAFYSQFCEHCIFERAHILDEEKEGCKILTYSFAFGIGDPEYPEEWTDRDGDPRCTKFSPYVERELKFDADGNVILPPARCTETHDLFNLQGER